MVAKQHMTVPRVCADCDEEFEICYYINAKRSPRCKMCQIKRDREIAKDKRAERDARKRVYTANTNVHTFPWKMIKDPDKSWGHDTRLCEYDIRLLVREKSILPGTAFRNIYSGEVVQVIEWENRNRLRLVRG